MDTCNRLVASVCLFQQHRNPPLQHDLARLCKRKCCCRHVQKLCDCRAQRMETFLLDVFVYSDNLLYFPSFLERRHNEIVGNGRAQASYMHNVPPSRAYYIVVPHDEGVDRLIESRVCGTQSSIQREVRALISSYFHLHPSLLLFVAAVASSARIRRHH